MFVCLFVPAVQERWYYGGTQLTVNDGKHTQHSDWAAAEIIVWDAVLNHTELNSVRTWPGFD